MDRYIVESTGRDFSDFFEDRKFVDFGEANDYALKIIGESFGELAGYFGTLDDLVTRSEEISIPEDYEEPSDVYYFDNGDPREFYFRTVFSRYNDSDGKDYEIGRIVFRAIGAKLATRDAFIK